MTLVLSDQLEDLRALGFGEGAESPFTKPDIRPPTSNAWAGASLSTIETFVQSAWDFLESIEINALDRTLYLVIDDEGFQDQTCIVAERNTNFEEKPSGNSNGANFDSPTVDGQGRWWTADDEEPDLTAEEEQKEAEELVRLEKEGLI
ncbi:hypothetical protein PG984_001730 [Apiospora sp. TS-2023a]